MTREEGKAASRTPEEAAMLVPAAPSWPQLDAVLLLDFLSSSSQSPS